MTAGPELRTERLLLRRWRESDRELFAALNTDPEVMEHYPEPWTPEQSDEAIDRYERNFEVHGFGLWAVEIRESHTFAGVVGLNVVKPPVPLAPSVEVGWRLARAHWGHGYASEAGHASLRFGFHTVGLGEIVAYTAATNARSRAVMERLRMTRTPERDFAHPAIPDGHPLQWHVVYSMLADRFHEGSA